ncbi:hypothetical protein OJAV_G00117390 [Oryzias javanicus]|uniref:Uncharacterized protein n=1 Tax=Oryzias javanicus TaxID=123683 RepID=A0A437CRX4_ORYJA|nr:hypothetical protein OJAV_G00117390 [Oryzias javanicus]
MLDFQHQTKGWRSGRRRLLLGCEAVRSVPGIRRSSGCRSSPGPMRLRARPHAALCKERERECETWSNCCCRGGFPRAQLGRIYTRVTLALKVWL